MSYPTNVGKLLNLNNEEWEALLASVWNAPVPRAVVRLNAATVLPTLTSSGKRAGRPRVSGEIEARVIELRSCGVKPAEIAKECGIALNTVKRILTDAAN